MKFSWFIGKKNKLKHMAFNKETGNLKLSGCLYQNFDKLVLVCHECTTDKGGKKIESNGWKIFGHISLSCVLVWFYMSPWCLDKLTEEWNEGLKYCNAMHSSDAYTDWGGGISEVIINWKRRYGPQWQYVYATKREDKFLVHL